MGKIYVKIVHSNPKLLLMFLFLYSLRWGLLYSRLGWGDNNTFHISFGTTGSKLCSNFTLPDSNIIERCRQVELLLLLYCFVLLPPHITLFFFSF